MASFVGLENAPAVRAVGEKLRRTVLGLGGSASAADVFVQLRGRPPKVDALLRHAGLLPSSAAGAQKNTASASH
jgi:oligopeptidase A